MATGTAEKVDIISFLELLRDGQREFMPKKPPKTAPDPDRYARHRERAGEYQRQQTAGGQEIGPLPPVANPERRALCLDSLDLFELTYFPARFPLPFSDAHLAMSERMERCIREGGLEAIAFQRGGGKTSIAEVKVIKAILYALRRFVVLLQATQSLAARSLKKIKRELEGNDLLAADFPEVCHPIRRLERSTRRQQGQKLNGRPTLIEWTADGVILPTVDGSPASGSVIHVAGITGAVKGLSMIGPNGEILRPDLVLIDDAQTRDSAKSPTQTSDREAVITDDVLGLAGPATTIAAINLCTPIYVNDLSERFLDHDKHPEWNGLRTSMLPKFPAKLDLWDEYAEVRRAEGPAAAAAFYHGRRAEMEAGAEVTWPARVKAGPFEGSTGLELAMILYYQNPRGFRAEYQCEPEADALGVGAKELAADAVAARLSGTERFLVPADCTRLTCMFDLGKSLHWYAVVAWTERFGGTVVDYGSWPRQNRSQFAANDPRPAIRDVVAGGDQMNEAQLVYAGLERLAAEVLGRTYYRVGGGEARVEICLVDSGDFTKAVYQFVQRHGRDYGCPVYPSKGIGRTMTARGVSEWKRRPGERLGYHWRLTTGEERRTQSVQFDTDAWKSFLHLALTTPPGGPTGLFFHGTSALAHAMIGDHCAAEYSEPKEIRGAWFDKWLDRPHKPDNHLWDTLVGAAVGASVLGVQFSATADGRVEAPAPKKPLSFADRQSGRAQPSTPTAPGAKKPLSYQDIVRQREQQRRGR
jgi:hypothetical protein